MNIIDTTINDILKIERRKLESLLSICMSPIEEKFLINFLKYYWESSLGIYDISYLYNKGTGHASKFNYPAEKSRIVSTYGSFIFGVLIKESILDIDIIIIPQYKVDTSKRVRYLDFAVFIKCYNCKSRISEQLKYFIECDGHEYHSAPDKIENDNLRANELKAAGWNEFRYSGRAINRNGFDAAHDIETYIYEEMKPQEKLWSGN
jgi:hypothetical protein